jgi:hypothetical protein
MSAVLCCTVTYAVCRWWIARRERRQARLEADRIARIQAAKAHNEVRLGRLQMTADERQALRSGRPVVIDFDRG